MSNFYQLSSGYKVTEFQELDSTMFKLKDMAAAGCEMNTVVRAIRQKKGRGRYGRDWISPEGNLYFSFLREAELKKDSNIFVPVFIVALSVAYTIIEISKNSILPSIKWPNDILINKSKVAGILIENINMNDNKDLLNIGVGINIISNPIETIYPSTNLKKENINVNPKSVLDVFFNNFLRLEKVYKIKGANEVFNMWSDLGHKIGDEVSVRIGEKTISGIFNGLSKEGGLILINKAGKQEVIIAGDVF